MTIMLSLLTIGMSLALILIVLFHLPRPLFVGIFRWLFRLLYRVEIVGMQHYQQLQPDERVLIVANHTSYLDGALLGVFLSERLTFAIDSDFINRWWAKPFLKYVNTYALDIANPLAAKDIIAITRQGKKCVIFPEGRITVTGSLMKIYEGPGLIADKAGAKILPIRLDGTQYSPFSHLKNKVRIQLFPKIVLTILPPQTISLDPAIKGRERRELIGLRLYDIMTDMIFTSAKRRQTLFTSLLDARNIHGGKRVIIEDSERKPLDYNDLIRRSFVLGKAFSALTQPSEYVGVLLPNSASVVSVFFALQAYGRVPALLNYRIGSRNLLASCQTAQLKTVITARAFLDAARLLDVAQQLQAVGIKLVYLEESVAGVDSKTRLMAWLASCFPHSYYRRINHALTSDADRFEQPAVVLFTSGSESTPKAVVLSHANMQANCGQMGSVIDFMPTDCVFNALPVFHSFGLTAALLLPLLNGIRVFLYPSPLHYRIIPELIYAANATILFGVDTFLVGYAHHAHPYDFYSLRYVFAGGERLQESTRRIWSERFGVRVFAGYGATETSPVLSCNTPMNHKLGTVGRFMPGIDYRLEAVPGIAQGGKLIVSGPNIMLGYLSAEMPGVLRTPQHGEYDTGDIVSIDAQGFVTLIDRVKRFAKIAAEMVSLTAVEDYLAAAWPNYQHAVVAVSTADNGEWLCCFTTYSDANRIELATYLRDHGVSTLYIPAQFTVVTELPLLPTGKVDYTQLRSLVEQT